MSRPGSSSADRHYDPCLLPPKRCSSCTHPISPFARTKQISPRTLDAPRFGLRTDTLQPGEPRLGLLDLDGYERRRSVSSPFIPTSYVLDSAGVIHDPSYRLFDVRLAQNAFSIKRDSRNGRLSRERGSGGGDDDGYKSDDSAEVNFEMRRQASMRSAPRNINEGTLPTINTSPSTLTAPVAVHPNTPNMPSSSSSHRHSLSEPSIFTPTAVQSSQTDLSTSSFPMSNTLSHWSLSSSSSSPSTRTRIPVRPPARHQMTRRKAFPTQRSTRAVPIPTPQSIGLLEQPSSASSSSSFASPAAMHAMANNPVTHQSPFERLQRAWSEDFRSGSRVPSLSRFNEDMEGEETVPTEDTVSQKERARFSRLFSIIQRDKPKGSTSNLFSKRNSTQDSQQAGPSPIPNLRIRRQWASLSMNARFSVYRTNRRIKEGVQRVADVIRPKKDRDLDVAGRSEMF